MNNITPEQMKERLEEVTYNLFSGELTDSLCFKTMTMRPSGLFKIIVTDPREAFADRHSVNYEGYNQDEAIRVYNSIK